MKIPTFTSPILLLSLTLTLTHALPTPQESSNTPTSTSTSLQLLQPPTHPLSPLEIESIRSTLSLYPLALDTKTLTLLPQIFAQNIQTIYPSPYGTLTNLTQLTTTISNALQCVTSQHFYGTQLIQLKSATKAASVTYIRAAHFGKNKLKGEVVNTFGLFIDAWEKGEKGWRVVRREVEFMGPTLGNQDVFQDC